ncbi:MAG: GTPase ObgE [Dehalococcoidia bacterium]|nr:GTPase ObgE [Dehalococcoidia bacterium]
MIDIAKITVRAGGGGNGCISFRREKFVPKGGPNGGDGGTGGNVYIVGDRSLNTLLHLKYHTTWRAKRAAHGGSNKKRGANGEDVLISVPIGTVVWRLTGDNGREALADISDAKPVMVARGGSGGFGYARFATSTHQEPILAEKGEEGEGATLLLELKLLADVGVIGQPNAGKSTLLSVCSAAKPKIAPYPFTTTDPVLGVVSSRNKDFVMMEVPGLIEGAHKGIGLGHEFLRHAERTRLLLHLLDGMSEDVLRDWRLINRELISFDIAMGKKPQFMVVNKIDIPEVAQVSPSLRKELEAQGVPVFFVSAATGEGVDILLGKVLEALDDLPKYDLKIRPDGPAIVKPRMKEAFRVTYENGVYQIYAPRVERLIPLANMKDWRVMVQLWRELQRVGAAKVLEDMGVQPGDTVRIGGVDMEWF